MERCIERMYARTMFDIDCRQSIEIPSSGWPIVFRN